MPLGTIKSKFRSGVEGTKTAVALAATLGFAWLIFGDKSKPETEADRQARQKIVEAIRSCGLESSPIKDIHFEMQGNVCFVKIIGENGSTEILTVKRAESSVPTPEAPILAHSK